MLNDRVTLHQVTAGTVLSRQGDQVGEDPVGVGGERTRGSGLVFVPTIEEEKTNTLNKNTPHLDLSQAFLLPEQSQLSASPRMQSNSVATASVKILYSSFYLFMPLCEKIW